MKWLIPIFVLHILTFNKEGKYCSYFIPTVYLLFYSPIVLLGLIYVGISGDPVSGKDVSGKDVSFVVTEGVLVKIFNVEVDSVPMLVVVSLPDFKM